MRFLFFCQGVAGYIEGTHIEIAALQIGEGVLLGVSLQEVLAVSKIRSSKAQGKHLQMCLRAALNMGFWIKSSKTAWSAAVFLTAAASRSKT